VEAWRGAVLLIAQQLFERGLGLRRSAQGKDEWHPLAAGECAAVGLNGRPRGAMAGQRHARNKVCGRWHPARQSICLCGGRQAGQRRGRSVGLCMYGLTAVEEAPGQQAGCPQR
jgi:hypothetical protein